MNQEELKQLPDSAYDRWWVGRITQSKYPPPFRYTYDGVYIHGYAGILEAAWDEGVMPVGEEVWCGGVLMSKVVRRITVEQLDEYDKIGIGDAPCSEEKASPVTIKTTSP
jgi:hypothetical protein